MKVYLFLILITTALCVNSSEHNAIYKNFSTDFNEVREIPEEYFGKTLDKKYIYFSQHDKRWNTIGQSIGLPDSYVNDTGCGPTSLAMVLHNFYPDSIENPATILKWEQECGNFPNQQEWGNSPDLFAQKFNLNYEVIPTRDKEKIFNHLQQGHMIVFNVGPGICPNSTFNYNKDGIYNTFTRGGHFMVMAGIEEENIRILDPANEIHTSNTNWTWNDILCVPSLGENQQWAFWID